MATSMQRTLRALARARRAFLGLAWLAMAGPMVSQAADTSAVLISARGEAIGTVSGRTTSFDGNAAMVGAYGVVSTRGYFADILPSGALGQVVSLLYAAADCGGAPVIEQSSVVGGPLPVPGYVFAFGAPVQVLSVPATATLREIEVASERQRTRDGYRCMAVKKRARVYPLADNQLTVSGFANQYAGPVKVKMESAPAGAVPAGVDPRRKTPVPDETGTGADVPPDTPECAVGCYMPYLGDHICESACANSLCGFDASDCSPAYVERAKQRESRLCAPTCEASSVGDGFCDDACNVASCNFDHGDCKR